MLLNILHFISISVTFFLTLSGQFTIAVVSYCFALFLTSISLLQNRRPKRNKKPDRDSDVRDVEPKTLTHVLITKTHGGRKQSSNYHRSEFGLTDIKIDEEKQVSTTRTSPILWCWIALLLGIFSWGAYNFMYRHEPYVPLSRVYEKIRYPQQTIKADSAPRVSSHAQPPIYKDRNFRRKPHDSGSVPRKSAQTGTIYSWTDEKGVTHHSNIAPPPNQKGFSTQAEITPYEKTTPIRIINNRVYVPVTYTNGDKTYSSEILLDTGCSTTVLPSKITNFLNAEYVGQTTSTVADGRTVRGQLQRIDSIKVGSHTVNDIVVISQRRAGANDKGLLGMNFLKHHPFSIDMQNKVIVWQ